MLENANDLKSYTIIKRIDVEISELNVTKQFKPKNYTVPMDFNGDNLVYIYKKLKKVVPETGPDLLLGVLDTNTLLSQELTGFSNNIRHLRLFKDGFVYVKDNKQVFYYNVKNLSDQFLYNHQFSVVSLAVSGNGIATIDKGLFINIMNHDDTSFVCNEINLMDAKDLPKDLQQIKLFEMEYPYFSKLSETHLAVSSDFGIVLVNFKNKV